MDHLSSHAAPPWYAEESERTLILSASRRGRVDFRTFAIQVDRNNRRHSPLDRSRGAEQFAKQQTQSNAIVEINKLMKQLVGKTIIKTKKDPADKRQVIYYYKRNLLN